MPRRYKPVRRRRVKRVELDIEYNWAPSNPSYELHSVKHVPSAEAPVTATESERDYINTLPPEMKERELKARRELEQKSKRVAPLHKSNYIYLGETPDEELLRGIGNKYAN